VLHPVDNCVAFVSDEELGARMSAESAAAERGLPRSWPRKQHTRKSHHFDHYHGSKLTMPYEKDSWDMY
jgi:hypothetical protein